MKELKLSMREILEMRSALEKLISQDLPIKVAFKYSVLYEKIKQNLKVFEDLRDKIFEKYKITNANFIFDSPEIKLNFENDFNELLNMEIDFGMIELLDFQLLNENINLSIRDIIELKKLFI